VAGAGHDPRGDDALRRHQVDEVEDELLARVGDAEQVRIAPFQLLVLDLYVESLRGLIHCWPPCCGLLSADAIPIPPIPHHPTSSDLFRRGGGGRSPDLPRWSRWDRSPAALRERRRARSASRAGRAPPPGRCPPCAPPPRWRRPPGLRLCGSGRPRRRWRERAPAPARRPARLPAARPRRRGRARYFCRRVRAAARG